MTMRAMRRKIFTGGAWGGATVLGGPECVRVVLETVQTETSQSRLSHATSLPSRRGRARLPRRAEPVRAGRAVAPPS